MCFSVVDKKGNLMRDGWQCSALLRAILRIRLPLSILYKMADECLAVAGKHVDDRYFHHGVASWLLA